QIYFDERLAFDIGLLKLKKRLFGGNVIIDLAKLWGAYSGTSTQTANATLIEQLGILTTYYPDKWTDAHKLGRVAYAVLILAFDQQELAAFPNITARLYDNRVLNTLTNNWEDSRNPAWSIRDYLLDEIAGARLKLDEIGEASFQYVGRIAHQSFFTAILLGDTTHYVLDGATDPEQSVQDNLRRMLTTMPAGLDWAGGEMHLRIRDLDATPVLELNDRNMVGDWTWQRGSPEDAANRIIARYVDAGDDPETGEPKDQVQEVHYPPDEWGENPFLDQDQGFHVERTLDLPFTTEEQHALSRAEEELAFLRGSLSGQGLVDETGLVLALYDKVSVKKDPPGFDGKEFWVTEIGINPDRTVALALREVAEFSPVEAPPVTALSGGPFEVITVPSASGRPARSWITLPFQRQGGVAVAVVDAPSAQITYLTDPAPNFGPGGPSEGLNMSYWAAVYVPTTNKVWVCNNAGGIFQTRIYAWDATTLALTDSILYDGNGPH
ncbi:MAG: phage tail protein, partial [Acidimicrobiia bacterium]